MKRSLPGKTLLFIAFIIGNLLVSGAAWGQTKTWDRGANTDNWGDPNNWSPDGEPTASHSVIIGAGNNVIVNKEGFAKDLTINNGGILTVNNNLTIPEKGSIVVNTGAYVVFSETAQIIGGGENGNKPVSFTIHSGANLTTANPVGFMQTITNGRSSGSFNVNIGNSTPTAYDQGINFTYNNSTKPQATGTAVIGANSLTILNPVGVKLTNPLNTLTTLNIGQELPGVFEDDGKTISSSGTINLNNGIFRLGNAATATSFPAFTVRNISLGTTIEYAAGVNQTVSSAPTYQNLTLSGSGTKSLSSGVMVKGIFAREGNVTIIGSAPSYDVSASLQYKGSSPQTTGIEFVTPWVAKGGVVIDNPNGVTLNDSKEIQSSLILRSGKLYISAQKTLTLSSHTVLGNGSFNNDWHIVTQVNGSDKGVLQVNNIPTTGYTFPVGDGTNYLPVTITPSSTNSFKVTVFTGITTNGEPGTPVQPEQRKNAVNAVWDVSRINGSGEVSLTLSWPKNQDLEGVGFYTAIPETKGLTHFTNGKWDNPEGTYDGGNNSVTRTGISSFSPFGVAMKGFEVLPVRFSSVKASEKPTGVQIDFTNLTESDVDYYEIERSADGKAYTTVKRLAPAKNDYGSAAYTYLDASAAEGRNLYRIKAVETTGKTVYSSVVSLTLGARNQALQVHAGGGQLSIQISSLPAGKYQVSIYSASGQLLKTESIHHSGGSFSQGMPLNNARSGVYILRVEGLVHMNKRFVVQP